MLLKVIDGEGQAQTAIVPGQETVTDRSATLAGDQTAQNVMDENETRSGWYFENPVGNDDMWVNDLAAATADTKSFKVVAGGAWPPPGYPLSTGALSVIGTVDQSFIAREW